MHKLIIAVILSTFILSSIAHAKALNMRAGLWEIRTTSDLLKLVPHIPSDQLKNMQDLAKEYGLEMPDIENGAAISQTCITQKMAAQKTLPNFYQEELGCATKNATRNGNRYNVAFVCNGADLKGDGSAQGLITSPHRFSGQTQFIGLANGVSVSEKADITGKWIGASCGNIKAL